MNIDETHIDDGEEQLLITIKNEKLFLPPWSATTTASIGSIADVAASSDWWENSWSIDDYDNDIVLTCNTDNLLDTIEYDMNIVKNDGSLEDNNTVTCFKGGVMGVDNDAVDRTPGISTVTEHNLIICGEDRAEFDWVADVKNGQHKGQEGGQLEVEAAGSLVGLEADQQEEEEKKKKNRREVIATPIHDESLPSVDVLPAAAHELQYQRCDHVTADRRLVRPMIIHTYAPKVIHTEPSDFMRVVQSLTGPSKYIDHDTTSERRHRRRSRYDHNRELDHRHHHPYAERLPRLVPPTVHHQMITRPSATNYIAAPSPIRPHATLGNFSISNMSSTTTTVAYTSSTCLSSNISNNMLYCHDDNDDDVRQ